MKNSKILFIIKMFFGQSLDKLKPYIKYYAILSLGLILLSSYIYIRFLRARLPRDIPFQLTFYGFILLLFICMMYIYSIKILLKPQIKHGILKGIIQKYLTPLRYITSSLQTVDFVIKNNSIIKPLYIRLKEYFIPIILEFGSMERILLAYFFMLIPGYLLLFILLVDVFWLHYIKIFYYFMFLHFLPLFYVYYRYSLKTITEELFAYLEERYDYIKIYHENYDYILNFYKKNEEAIYNEKEVSIREYFDIQLKHQDREYPEYDKENPESYEIIYVGYAYGNASFYENYAKVQQKTIAQSTHTELQMLQKDFNLIEPTLLKLLEYMDLNQHTHNLAYIKELRIILCGLYFITWSYILIKSIHTLPLDRIEDMIPKHENPFT